MANTTDTGGKKGTGLGDVLDALPTDRLLKQSRELAAAAGERAVSVAGDKVGDMTERLIGYVTNGPRGDDDGGSDDGGSGNGGGTSVPRMLLGAGAAGLKQMVTSKLGGGKGKGKGGGKLKLTNIVEEVEVGVPVRVAYNQWTQFQDFPKFTKRLEQADQESDTKIRWKAGIFLSHRTWESTIVEQVPDELIVWRSKGAKGHVDGAVTFHELAPNLTKILLNLEYHPQGLFERVGNIWRAQGRRTRLELKHYRRHVMTHTILDQDDVEGWRGEIRDSKVVRSHEDAVEAEQNEQNEQDEQDGRDEQDEYDDRDDQDERPDDEDAWDGDEYDDGGEADEDEAGTGDDYDEDEEQDEADDGGDQDEEPYDEDRGEEDEYDDEEPYEDEDEAQDQDQGEEDEYDDEEPYEDEDEAQDQDENDEDEDAYETDDDEREGEERPAGRTRRRAPARAR